MISRLLRFVAAEVFELMKARPELYRLWIAVDDAWRIAREAGL